MKILPRKFFDRSTLIVAKNLLGKFLVRKIGNRKISGMITEVEAYVGPHDKASHASKGKTERTKTMFGKAGHWYAYLVYGMHWCLNIVTEKENYPAAILIRSVLTDSLKKPRFRNTRVGSGNINVFINKGGVSKCGFLNKKYPVQGPGRVTKFFKINKKLNGKPALPKTGLWIENRGVKIPARKIRRGKRIGVDYAGRWKNKLWRFYCNNQA